MKTQNEQVRRIILLYLYMKNIIKYLLVSAFTLDSVLVFSLSFSSLNAKVIIIVCIVSIIFFLFIFQCTWTYNTCSMTTNRNGTQIQQLLTKYKYNKFIDLIFHYYFILFLLF